MLQRIFKLTKQIVALSCGRYGSRENIVQQHQAYNCRYTTKPSEPEDHSDSDLSASLEVKVPDHGQWERQDQDIECQRCSSLCETKRHDVEVEFALSGPRSGYWISLEHNKLMKRRVSILCVCAWHRWETHDFENNAPYRYRSNHCPASEHERADGKHALIEEKDRDLDSSQRWLEKQRARKETLSGAHRSQHRVDFVVVNPHQ